jgi:hypothetical protein
MYLQTENPHPFTFIVSEPEGPFRARDTAKAALNAAFLVGTVLGAQLTLTPAGTVTSAAAPDADNTGNGALTLDAVAPVGAAAKDGIYRVVLTAATAFTVTDPNGKEIGKGTVGTAFAKDVKFVLAAGGTAFAAGDAFGITVGIESLKDQVFVPLNPAATDGSQIPAGISCHNVVANASVSPVFCLFDGPGEVRGSDLIWPGSITAAQKAEAVEGLRRLGIKIR